MEKKWNEEIHRKITVTTKKLFIDNSILLSRQGNIVSNEKKENGKVKDKGKVNQLDVGNKKKNVEAILMAHNWKK